MPGFGGRVVSTISRGFGHVAGFFRGLGQRFGQHLVNYFGSGALFRPKVNQLGPQVVVPPAPLSDSQGRIDVPHTSPKLVQMPSSGGGGAMSAASRQRLTAAMDAEIQASSPSRLPPPSLGSPLTMTPFGEGVVTPRTSLMEARAREGLNMFGPETPPRGRRNVVSFLAGTGLTEVPVQATRTQPTRQVRRRLQ